MRTKHADVAGTINGEGPITIWAEHRCWIVQVGDKWLWPAGLLRSDAPFYTSSLERAESRIRDALDRAPELTIEELEYLEVEGW